MNPYRLLLRIVVSLQPIQWTKVRAGSIPALGTMKRSSLWSPDHSGERSFCCRLVGLYTFYYLKSEEDRPLIGEQQAEKGGIRYSFSLLKKNFLCSFVKVLSPRMEMGLPYFLDAIYWYTKHSVFVCRRKMRCLYEMIVVLRRRSLINFIDLFGSIKKCRTFVVCFSWY